MECVEFKLGEKKYICISVTSTTGNIEVTSAKYLLLSGDETEDSGMCEIKQKASNEVILSAIVQPQRNNTVYRLEFTYEILPEILKHDVLVNVY